MWLWLFLRLWSLLWHLGLPVVLIYLWKRGRKDPLYARHLGERFGRYRPRLPGAVWIPLGELPTRLNDIPKDKTVVAVCRSGNRSSQATSFLRGQGFDNVHNMTGGMNDWQQAG